MRERGLSLLGVLGTGTPCNEGPSLIQIQHFVLCARMRAKLCLIVKCVGRFIIFGGFITISCFLFYEITQTK